MTGPIKSIDAAGLKAALHDGAEIALLDAREEVPFDTRHILMASCLPLGRIEVSVDDLVPRRGARVIWCDDGEGLAAQAAERMTAIGYMDVSVLEAVSRHGRRIVTAFTLVCMCRVKRSQRWSNTRPARHTLAPKS